MACSQLDVQFSTLKTESIQVGNLVKTYDTFDVTVAEDDMVFNLSFMTGAFLEPTFHLFSGLGRGIVCTN